MKKRLVLLIVLLVIGGAIWYLESTKPERNSTQDTQNAEIVLPSPRMNTEDKAKLYARAREIVNPAGFVNTDGIALKDLIGKKVVLIDFWTYSCINCQNTIPYINAWYEKYKDKGLEIVGVHSPEFPFEEKYENVKKAVERFGIKYPVVLDNSFATWYAYENHYWPAKYLIDIDGFISYAHFGEGAYAETERKIQEFLAERAEVLKTNETIQAGIVKPEGIDGEPRTIGSPEIYFGAERNTYLGNGTPEQIGAQHFTEPVGMKTNILYLVGDWNFTPKYAENTETPARIIFRYNAKKVFFVASSDAPVDIVILRDGEPLGKFSGGDVKTVTGESRATIRDARLYKLIEDTVSGEHTIEIIPQSKGLRAFTFTFG